MVQMTMALARLSIAFRVTPALTLMSRVNPQLTQTCQKTMFLTVLVHLIMK
jgi:hypothetical protein